jgi:transcriptional regulator with XRE-family HTH domain
LKTVLVERGILQQELADQIGYVPEVVSHVVNGHTSPSTRFRRRCADVLGVDEGELFPEAVDRLLAERRAQGFGPEPSAAAVKVIGETLRRAAK